MAERTITVHPDPKADREFTDLVARCYRETPDRNDLLELRRVLDGSPELWSNVLDITHAVRQWIAAEMVTQPAAIAGLRANIQDIKNGLDYDQSPQVERLLIDAVVTAWLRWQWAEMRYSQHTGSDHSMREGEYWLQTAGAAQRRYLRAVETLARVRRITRATLQINIAEAGSQQVNIAGDVVK